jgi:hypothetical protein
VSNWEVWQRQNEDYLAAALTWLRLRLQQFIEADGSEVVTPQPDESSKATAISAKQQAQLSDAMAAMAAAEAADPPPALVILSRLLGLSRFEMEILLLCAAMELDMRTAGLCARAHTRLKDSSDQPNPYPTFALALTLFDDPAWVALSPERPLRYWRLLEINQPGSQPLTTSPLRVDERIVNYLKGLNDPDDRLAPYLTLLDEADGNGMGSEINPLPLPTSQQAVVDRIVELLKQGSQVKHIPLMQLTGSDAEGKQLIARRAAQALGLRLYHFGTDALPSQPADIEMFTRLWQRESLLLPVALYLDAQELEFSNGSDGGALQVPRFLSRVRTRISSVIFLAVREIWPNLMQQAEALEVSRPTPAEQQAAWRTALAKIGHFERGNLDPKDDRHPTVEAKGSNGLSANLDPAVLTGQFNLNLPAIQDIVSSALAGSAHEDGLGRRVWEACLVRTRPRLDTLAQRLDPKATWEEIVLPEAEMRLLHQISDQVGQRHKVYEEWGFRRRMNRGLGINALFAGESGTGKTMAAEVIANDLGLNLYRIDLSAVVSKYIGETEKNLRRLFDAAEDGGAILFFDEADALFGKRSEVKDSHDRYANIEINYLLQRMEAYRGLAILATNMKNALDTAFMRRLRFVVNFPFPNLHERVVIWQKVYPPETPKEALNYDRLSRLNLTGGSIHNIALNAAFLAAKAGGAVTMQLILEAAREEFRKLEKPLNEADFRWEPKVTVNV